MPLMGKPMGIGLAGFGLWVTVMGQFVRKVLKTAVSPFGAYALWKPGCEIDCEPEDFGICPFSDYKGFGWFCHNIVSCFCAQRKTAEG